MLSTWSGISVGAEFSAVGAELSAVVWGRVLRGTDFSAGPTSPWGRVLAWDEFSVGPSSPVFINNVWSILMNNTTANIDIPLTRSLIFLAVWHIFMHLELFLPLALSFMTTSQRWWAWWRNTRKTSASSTWTRTWDVFCHALTARFTNRSQILVCGDDADVFILLFHHAHRLCGVIMELDVSGRNNKWDGIASWKLHMHVV